MAAEEREATVPMAREVVKPIVDHLAANTAVETASPAGMAELAARAGMAVAGVTAVR